MILSKSVPGNLIGHSVAYCAIVCFILYKYIFWEFALIK